MWDQSIVWIILITIFGSNSVWNIWNSQHYEPFFDHCGHVFQECQCSLLNRDLWGLAKLVGLCEWSSGQFDWLPITFTIIPNIPPRTFQEFLKCYTRQLTMEKISQLLRTNFRTLSRERLLSSNELLTL